MQDVVHHPQNPVAKDQKFLTCGGCKYWGRAEGGTWVKPCNHPGNQNMPVVPSAYGKTMQGKITLGHNYSGGGGEIPFYIRVESENAPNQLGPRPLMGDLQTCSGWDEQPGT